MAKQNQKNRRPQARDRAQNELPPGVKLLRTFEGHEGSISSLAFDPEGDTLASAGYDERVKLWDARSGIILRTLKGHHQNMVWSLAFDPHGNMLATGSLDHTVKLWDLRSNELLHTLVGQRDSIVSLAFNQKGDRLASGSHDETIKLWDTRSGKLLRTLQARQGFILSLAFDPLGDMMASGGLHRTVKLWNEHSGKLLHTLEGHQADVRSLAFDPQGERLASGSFDNTIKVWETRNGKLLRTLEGHTFHIDILRFSSDGRVLVSKSADDTIRVWSCETWETIAVIPARSSMTRRWNPALALHPKLPLVAAPTSRIDSYDGRLIGLWELDYELLLGTRREKLAAPSAVHHTTGKIILVGDHSVGKSALGHRLIHGRFEKQESTHGQQFWVFPALGKRREDGTECEAILWDFAGQPDYRLVHALLVDNSDLALVLFDSADIHDPLHGVGFWLKQLQTGQSRCPIILVAAQTDRGNASLTPEELKAFCQSNGIVGPVVTSSKTGVGVDELIDCMRSLIPWEDKPATVTTTTFKRIKDYVLGLKQTAQRQIIVTPDELRARLEATDAEWQFTDHEMLTAVGHLENYGYVKRLRTSKGELRILLQPERLNNLASSFVLEARRSPKGLGALEEKRLLAGGYNFAELKDLDQADRDVLLDSAALLFLEHNVCFRETDPLRMESYLVFPELINLKKPLDDDSATEDGVAYTVIGPTENVFASLVVLLGYTHTFTRITQWQNNARYEVGNGVCGFRQEAERDGELDFVLCFSPNVGASVHTLLQGLFESFLSRRNLTVLRYEPIRCTNPKCGESLDRSVMRQRMKEEKAFAFCNNCGKKLKLPAMAKPIQLAREVQVEVESQTHAADQRTVFEKAVFRLCAYIAEQKITPPECFISYAWGDVEHERWVEKRLATDLQKAGIEVLLDRWHNAQIGASVGRFAERIEKANRIIVVGTPLYRSKYENKNTETGYVVAAEVDLIHNRLLGTEIQKASVLPLLLAGEKTAALPPLLHGRVYADFRNDSSYFTTAFDLILSLYELPPNHPAVADLRESLRPPDLEFRN